MPTTRARRSRQRPADLPRIGAEATTAFGKMQTAATSGEWWQAHSALVATLVPKPPPWQWPCAVPLGDPLYRPGAPGYDDARALWDELERRLAEAER